MNDMRKVYVRDGIFPELAEGGVQLFVGYIDVDGQIHIAIREDFIDDMPTEVKAILIAEFDKILRGNEVIQ